MTGPRLSQAEVRALDAILALAAADPAGVVSERRLAERLGCSRSTAQWHRARLARKGYIRLLERGRREAPAVIATRQRRPDVAFGICQVCNLARPLDPDGLVRGHDRARRACPGSGRTPAVAA